ncbi:perlucin-like protein [Strongylocentrotus purpuratus]|uniref:C-type lectin domain-containing protein n=1 Tax=Strongylocentrotus purpuratus TaxID=7668 RepID=A0A7M7GMH0_STRPU|nr:perlucin-like protein [Strongylocentrotus purpuratus]XP_030848440.1 perlucin-like protein [Strongylocentrotus purpuratus]|eukprot:XP_003729542.1 PREDICTED: perlucin-like protein [Strongylocentrotus purpuratus]
MKLLLTLMTLTALAIFGLTEATCQCECSDGWSLFGRNCYRFFSPKVNWQTAHDACQDLGADLVSIHDEAENAFAFALILTDDGKKPTSWSAFAWIGLHQPNEPFVWSDGSCLNYENWAPGQPDDARGGEDCGHLRNYGPPGSWNDLGCNNRIGYICKK